MSIDQGRTGEGARNGRELIVLKAECIDSYPDSFPLTSTQEERENQSMRLLSIFKEKADVISSYMNMNCSDKGFNWLSMGCSALLKVKYISHLVVCICAECVSQFKTC